VASGGWEVYVSASGLDAVTEFAASVGDRVAGEVAVRLHMGFYITGTWSHRLQRQTLRVVWVHTEEFRYGAVYRPARLLRPRERKVLLVIFKDEDQQETVPPNVITAAASRVRR
jgi:hypothetical protein